jgi:hypothetical protein
MNWRPIKSPVKLLFERSRNSRDSSEKVVDIWPVNRLPDRSSVDRFVQEEREVGKLPVSLLFDKLRKFKLLQSTARRVAREILLADKSRERSLAHDAKSEAESTHWVKLFADKSRS